MFTKGTNSHIHLIPTLCTILLFNYFTPSIFVLTAPNHKLPENIDSKQEFEDALENFLSVYYDELISQKPNENHLEMIKKFDRNRHRSKNIDGEELGSQEVSGNSQNNSANVKNKQSGDDVGVDIYDQMQGDQPVNDYPKVTSEEVTKTRERLRKENWVEYLKSQILNHIGRSNSTFTKPPEDPPLTDFNITEIIPKLLNTTTLDDDQITEKIRSFYPSCEPPQNQDQDLWREEEVMNLYFDFDYNSDNKNSNIATATLRLYRLPQNGTNNFSSKKDDCDNLDSVEEDKLLRVSVYWYTKYQKKRRVKKRLSDSKVVSETSRWVELSVKPATKAWNKAGGRNLGLGISVEDQEGKSLRADRYFKGASCTVGVSTPKPIPTIVRDASHLQADELDRIHSLLGKNSTSTVYSDVLLLPTVDICYLEFPENTDISHYNSARINACNLRKIHEENQRLAERERVERLATLQFPASRHIRHQRQHRQTNKNTGGNKNTEIPSDFESNFRNSLSNKQIIFTREELENLQRNRDISR